MTVLSPAARRSGAACRPIRRPVSTAKRERGPPSATRAHISARRRGSRRSGARRTRARRERDPRRRRLVAPPSLQPQRARSRATGDAAPARPGPRRAPRPGRARARAERRSSAGARTSFRARPRLYQLREAGGLPRVRLGSLGARAGRCGANSPTESDALWTRAARAPSRHAAPEHVCASAARSERLPPPAHSCSAAACRAEWRRAARRRPSCP